MWYVSMQHALNVWVWRQLCVVKVNFFPVPPTQLHGNVEEDLEQLKLEEAAMQRRKKLLDGRGSLGVANGGRLSADGDHFTLAQLQKKRKELGEG